MPNPPANLLLVGIFGAAVGLKGEVRLKSYTGDPQAIAGYSPLQTDDGRRFEIVSVRPQKDMLVARVRGIADRTAAERLVNLKLYAPREAFGATEDEDEFFHADLIGLNAVTTEGETLGRVIALFDFGAGDVLEIMPAGGGMSFFLPFTRAVVPSIDIARRRMTVIPPEETETGETPDNAR